MARYCNDLVFTGSQQDLFAAIHRMMDLEGYEYTTYAEEQVFKKGKGILTAPRFVKISFSQDKVRVEAWIKIALLPGVYMGELGLTGFYAAALKKPLRDLVNQIEMMCMNANRASVQTTESTADAPVSQLGFCANCGAKLEDGTNFCASCGQPVDSSFNGTQVSYMDYMGASFTPGQRVTKKEYIDQYAPRSVKNDIRNAAICCYVCAGISILAAWILEPLGIINALILLGLALGMHLGKSKVCAIVLLIFSCIECLLCILLTGTVGGWLWIVASIWAVVSFNKIDKQYRAFIAENGLSM